MLLYVFAMYVFVVDLVYYLILLHPIGRITAQLFLIVVVVFLCWISASLTLPIMLLTECPMLTQPRSMLPKACRVIMISGEPGYWKIIGSPFPIVLVAGEGGGSRAGFWFSQNMIDLDDATNGKFREHVFSISTVSGSTVG